MTRLSYRAASTLQPSSRCERLRRHLVQHARATLALVSTKLDALRRAAYQHSKRRVSHKHSGRATDEHTNPRATREHTEPRCADCGETFGLVASDGSHICTNCATTEAVHAFLQGPA